MSGSSTASPALARRLRPFLGGLALAFGVFVVFFRFEIGGPETRLAAGLAPAVVFAGAGLGAVLGRAARRGSPLGGGLLAVACVAVWAWLAMGQPDGGWLATAILSVAGLGASSGLVAATWPEQGGATSLALGAAAGLGLCAAGLMGALGIAPVALGSVILTAAFGLAGARRGTAAPVPPPGPDAHGLAGERARRAARILLAAAVGAASVGLLRAYVPAARSPAYAASDLGAALALGVVVFLLALRGHARAGGLLVMGAVGVAAVAMLCGCSFFLYPDLVVSETAAMQTPASLLVPGRVFPLWVLVFVLGLAAGSTWGAVGDAMELPAALAASAAGAAGAGLMAGAYRAAYFLPVALAFLCVAVVCLSRRARAERRGVALPVGALVLCAVAGAWLLAADPHLGWAGLAKTLREYMSRTPERRAGGGEVSVTEARITASGLRAVLTQGRVRAEFMDGNLAAVARPGRGPDSDAAPLSLTAALGLAFSPAAARVGVVGTSLDIVADTARRLAVGSEVRPVGVWGADPGGALDVIICGPGPVSGCNPLAVMSREGLARLKARLAADGVLCMWFPAGRVSLSTLEDALATLRDVFPVFYIFISGEEAVFVATSSGSLPFRNLEKVQRSLGDAGFPDPLDLVQGFVADADDLAPLAKMGSAFRLSHPRRPPALARDLTDRRAIASLAALLQYRQLGPGRLLKRLSFESEAKQFVALRGFADIYRDGTWRAFQGFALSDAGEKQELVRFLGGAPARLDLFAPEAEGRAVGMAGALSASGLHEAAAQTLRKAIEEGQETFTMHFRLAEVLEDLNRRDEALSEYRRALVLRPGSADARDRMVLLLLGTGRNRDAAGVLRQTLEQEPENVQALLMLARLCAGPLRSPAEAADLAQRVLRMEPENAAAQDLLMLSRKQAGGAK